MLRWEIDAVNTPAINQLCHEKKFLCLATCRKWLRQYLALSYIRSLRNAGNRAAAREIKGEALIQLAFFRMLRPHARLYEVQVYLSNRFPTIEPFSKSQILRPEKQLGLCRKAASTTSQEAYHPRNLEKRRRYWEDAYPNSVAGEMTDEMIDIDEALNFEASIKRESQGLI
jgi:hypothetical protein